ncbi:dTDP-4-dehydrorhamnose reductase [Paramicrobacterium sp. CJ85]|uniref:dTDP-4-dehydrorhamnose reductase n=1 Tax=Paramicrobacterium sp. CJ85 TaxID=3445355 RepID=UPI003F61056D
MRILITGAGGMLGTELCEQLSHHDVTAPGHDELDIADASAVRRWASGHDVIINAAAYTDVDGAETDEDAATRVNAEGPRFLAEAAKSHGARLVQISTDYVFDGSASAPYDEDAPLHPASAYGRSKAAGERFVRSIYPEGSIIARTAWLYGRHGRSFPATMLALAATRETIDVVADQCGQPTWARDVAARIRFLLDRRAAPGVYHCTNSGEATWYDFARAVFEECGLDPDRIRPTDSSHFVRPARRPQNSVLGHAAWHRERMSPLQHWREALHDAARTGVFDDALGQTRGAQASLG